MSASLTLKLCRDIRQRLKFDTSSIDPVTSVSELVNPDYRNLEFHPLRTKNRQIT